LAGEDATTAANTTKGAAGGRNDVAKRSEPLSEGRKPSDRLPNHPRARPGATRARCPFSTTGEAANGTSSARGVTGRSFAPRPGWPTIRASRGTSEGGSGIAVIWYLQP